MADPVGLVHMNGRVYDPRLGRFLQADPYVGDPSSMLSLNRYAYAHGNPLANVDPSGHIIESLGVIVGIVLSAKQWIDAWSVGGRGGIPVPEAFRDGIPAGASGWTFGGGFEFPREGLGGGTRRGAGWGSVGGLPTVLQGGRFGHSPVASSLRDCLSGSAGDALGRPVAPPRPWWVSLRSALGGTFSSQSGGKFSNAAATAAFRSMLSGKASPSAGRNQVPIFVDSVELTSGPGKWVTVSIEKRTALNLIHVVMTRVSTLSEGRPIGSDGMDYRNTVRDVTQEWQRLSSVEEENLRSDGLISVERMYGETRVIKQTYVEGKDDWTVSGRSWHWHPVHADVEYEFEPID